MKSMNMDFNRRGFLKGVSLAAFAGAASPRLMAEGTTLASPTMSKGLSRPGRLQVVEHDVALLHVGLYQLVAPPCEKHVLGLQVGVVRAAEVQVFKCEKLVLRCH